MPPEESFVARMGQGVFLSWWPGQEKAFPAFGKPDRPSSKTL